MEKVSGKELILQDLQELVKRLNSRMEDALRMFAQKRSRNHFEHIFFNRYKDFSLNVLEDLDSDVYPRVVSIYEEIDELLWYLQSTEDMPSLVKTKVDSYIKSMNSNYAEVLENLISENVNFENTELNADQDLTEEDPLYVSNNEEYFETNEVEVPPPFIENEKDDNS